VALLAAAAVLLTGCFTGKRPRFSDDPFPPGSTTGNVQLDSLLKLLDSSPSGPATVAYTVLRKAGVVTTPATVAVRGTDQAITIGLVKFVDSAGTRQTCVDGTCSDQWLVQKVSDTGVTPTFFNEQPARKIRRLAPALIGPVVSSVVEIGGESAQCRSLPVTGGTATYCAYESGLLAKMDDGDVLVTATQAKPSVDEAAFSAP